MDFHTSLYKIIDGLKDLHSLYLFDETYIKGMDDLFEKYKLKISKLRINSYDYRADKGYYKNYALANKPLLYEEIDDNLGYIYIPDFTEEDMFEKMDEYMEILGDKEGIIIDIRYNRGGAYLNIINVIKYFVDEVFTINFTQKLDKNVFNHQYFEFLRRGDKMYKGKVVLLTNGHSYSAANCFAAVFMDHNLGTIIGEKTLGGGSARITTPLPNGFLMDISAGRMTFTDNEGNFIENGVEPDIEIIDNYYEGEDSILNVAVDYLINQ